MFKNCENIEKAKARLAEFENIVKCLYEDRVKSGITDVRFASLADSYEQEENKIRNDISEWQSELDIISDTKEQTKLFADSVKKETEMYKNGELSPEAYAYLAYCTYNFYLDDNYKDREKMNGMLKLRHLENLSILIRVILNGIGKLH